MNNTRLLSETYFVSNILTLKILNNTEQNTGLYTKWDFLQGIRELYLHIRQQYSPYKICMDNPDQSNITTSIKDE